VQFPPIPHSQKRLAIFGGTFDPVHNGHLALARAALSLFELQAVFWVPTQHPPHKSQGITSSQHRTAMVRAAIAPYPHFHLGPQTTTFRYAIDTFTHLQTLHPDSEWYWLLGSDTFRTLPRWYRRHQLLPAITWLVFPRSTNTSNPLESNGEPTIRQLHSQGIPLRWHLISASIPPISSTQIRQAYHQSQPLSHHLPEAVVTYITTHKLYR
jgi:nicotinate-nucleotide adenylyltransferase